MKIDDVQFEDAINNGINCVIFYSELDLDGYQYVKNLEGMIKNFQLKINVYLLNIDENIKYLAPYSIKVVPTVCFFINSIPKTKIEGRHKFDVYQQQMESLSVTFQQDTILEKLEFN